jgi:hypothetical protein
MLGLVRIGLGWSGSDLQTAISIISSQLRIYLKKGLRMGRKLACAIA